MKTGRRILSAMLASVMLIMPTGCDDTADDGDSPSLSSTGWTYGQVAMGGGGFVTGVFTTPEEGLYYARTDVGGAYRYDSEAGKWESLSYFVSEEDRGLLGVDGLAYDPSAPNKVYLLTGTGYFSDGKTAIMRSDDYGETFETVVVTDLITANGNGMGRQNGERIAVDPNNGDIILCGGRTGGLIRSTDGGVTWAKVESFPVDSTHNSNGINGIVFDKASSGEGEATKRIYVTVSRKDADNLFVSEDGGETWSAVEGMPTAYMPQRLRIDSEGRLLVTYSGSEGPHGNNGGAAFRYDPVTGTAKDISPEANVSMGDIAVDPNNPYRLVACTENVWVNQPNGSYGDKFYVSEDGGDSWTCINNSMTMSNGGVEWVTGYAIHWCGCLAIDPFDTDSIMVISGNGIFRCENIWDDSPAFAFFSDGIEETVPLDCVSVKGGNLVTAIGDYDGFDHSDVMSYGRLHTEAIGTTTGIAVAGQNHDVWVKVGGDENAQKILYSEDGGDSWTYITNQPDASRTSYKGKVALTADGGTIIWSPEGALFAYYTTDRGETWEQVSGLRGGAYIFGDSVNPDYVYACANNNFYVSSDGGKSFTSTLTALGSSNRIAVAADIEGKVYIPGTGYGLYVTTDHGESFTRLETVRVCSAVGLGRGKTDSDPYVIYIWGQPTAEDPTGIYMSEDEGATWSQVNDELHRFGGPGNGYFIVGDYNVYGRCYMSSVGLGVVYCDKTDKG